MINYTYVTIIIITDVPSGGSFQRIFIYIHLQQCAKAMLMYRALVCRGRRPPKTRRVLAMMMMMICKEMTNYTHPMIIRITMIIMSTKISNKSTINATTTTPTITSTSLLLQSRAPDCNGHGKLRRVNNDAPCRTG